MSEGPSVLIQHLVSSTRSQAYLTKRNPRPTRPRNEVSRSDVARKRPGERGAQLVDQQGAHRARHRIDARQGGDAMDLGIPHRTMTGGIVADEYR